jgi:hypothetical protein
MKIHIGFGDTYNEFNTSIWRCLIPGKGLEQAGHTVTYSHISEIGKHDADSYLLERHLFHPEAFTAIENLREKDKHLVATFDDHYAIMPDTCASKKTWDAENLKKFYSRLEMMDSVIVPNRLLAEDYRPFCKDIRYVPNYADPDLYKYHHKKHATFNILWGGNSTHLQGLKESGFLKALGKLCAKHPEVRVIAVADPMCTIALSEHIPAHKLSIERGWKSLQVWTKFVADNADLITCPLYGEYDRRRSWVKAIDSVMFGIPLVASNLDPFKDTGVLLTENTARCWYDALSDMFKSPFRRNNIIARTMSTLGSVSIHDHIKEYEEVLGCNRYQSTR